MELDDYTGSVFRFLEKTKPGQIFTIEKICKSENRERFIEAVKLWIRSFPFGAGVEFNCDYTKIKIFDINIYLKMNEMERTLYNQNGSVEDIRCTLNFVNPGTRQKAFDEVERLTESIENEKQNQNRTTVVKLLESKKAKIDRLIETKLND